MRAKSQSKTVIVQWTAQRNTWVRGWKGKGELSKISSFVVSDHTIFYNNRAATSQIRRLVVKPRDLDVRERRDLERGR